MSPIEYLWIVVVVLFGFVGVIRGYTKELGVTTMCVAGLLLVLQFGDRFIMLTRTNMGDSFPWVHTASFGAGFSIGLYLIIVFISYQGITLNFKGSAPVGVLSPILGMVVGLLNGYFVAGTVWHYMHTYRYPFGSMNVDALSDTAQAMLRFLPPHIFEQQPGFLLALLLLLLILSVWK